MGYERYNSVVIYGWCPDYEVHLTDIQHLEQFAGNVNKGSTSEVFYGTPVILDTNGVVVVPEDVMGEVQDEYRRVFPNAQSAEVESECCVYCVLDGDYETTGCMSYTVKEFQTVEAEKRATKKQKV